jgi:hypothetical protein
MDQFREYLGCRQFSYGGDKPDKQILHISKGGTNHCIFDVENNCCNIHSAFVSSSPLYHFIFTAYMCHFQKIIVERVLLSSFIGYGCRA